MEHCDIMSRYTRVALGVFMGIWVVAVTALIVGTIIVGGM
jgi:hypothetical protein